MNNRERWMGGKKEERMKKNPEYRIQEPREKRVEMGEKMTFELPRHREDKRKKRGRNRGRNEGRKGIEEARTPIAYMNEKRRKKRKEVYQDSISGQVVAEND
jgi:hypothetical protein